MMATTVRMGITLCLLTLDSALAQTAPKLLSENDLYSDFGQRTIAPHNLPYAPVYPLWSDGAVKRRWINLPAGSTIDTTDVDKWVFPVGTKLWKEFSFKDQATGEFKRVETRLLWKQQNGDTTKWRYYTYVWNADGTDAVLDPGMGQENVFPTGQGTSHDVPNRTDCQFCHANGGEPVLGFGALQLSSVRDPRAPHAETPPEGALTVEGLQTAGLLSKPIDKPTVIASENEVERTALGYLYANCANCHKPGGGAAFTGLLFHYSLASEATPGQFPAIVTGNNQANTQYRAVPLRIKGGHPDESAVIVRMKVPNRVFPRMPMMGTEIVDQEAVDLLSEWIKTLPAGP